MLLTIEEVTADRPCCVCRSGRESARKVVAELLGAGERTETDGSWWESCLSHGGVWRRRPGTIR